MDGRAISDLCMAAFDDDGRGNTGIVNPKAYAAIRKEWLNRLSPFERMETLLKEHIAKVFSYLPPAPLLVYEYVDPDLDAFLDPIS